MRIATWNCARGPWAVKRGIAESLGADLAVVTEAPISAAEDGIPWFGSPLGQNGTSVLAGPEYRVEVLPLADVPPCVNALRVTGPVTLTLLTVWTWPAPGYKNYKAPLLAGLDACRYLSGPFVIAGDFNGNARFDKPRTRLKWRDCIAAVEAFGVVSAYHTFFNEAFGEESRPTQYQLRYEGRPFHVDYVFVPAFWRSAIRSVEVPGYGEYTASDHRPVIVDVALP